MSHLGRWLTALVDGELDQAERDHVLNHLAGCSPCLREANEMRALKRRLTALGESCDDAAIAGRLIELARFEQDTLGPLAGPGGQRPGARTLAREAGRRLVPGAVVRQGWTVAAGSAATALAVIGVTAFVLGSTAGAPPAPKVTPSVDSYVLQHAYDAGQAPARSGSGSSTLQPDHGLTDPAAGPASSGAQAYGRWHTTASTLISSGPVTPAVASPTVSTPASPGGLVDQSPGQHSARYKAP